MQTLVQLKDAFLPFSYKKVYASMRRIRGMPDRSGIRACLRFQAVIDFLAREFLRVDESSNDTDIHGRRCTRERPRSVASHLTHLNAHTRGVWPAYHDDRLSSTPSLAHILFPLGPRLSTHPPSHRPLETRPLARSRDARPAARRRMGRARAGRGRLERATRRGRGAPLVLAEGQVVLRRAHAPSVLEVCRAGAGVDEWKRAARAEHRVGAE